MRLAEIAGERLAGLPGYAAGQAGPGPLAGKLSSNEAPLGPAPAVRAAIAARADRSTLPSKAEKGQG